METTVARRTGSVTVPRRTVLGQRREKEPIWEKYLDIVTLFRYILQQSRNSDSGLPLRGGPVFIWRIRVVKRRRQTAKTSKLTLVGGVTPRLRKSRRSEWTRIKEQAFLTALAHTCNVTAAADAAGVSVSNAYARRKKLAAFRAGWAEAIATAYQRLELVMLDRALTGPRRSSSARMGAKRGCASIRTRSAHLAENVPRQRDRGFGRACRR
jgi:hypothetical protein